MNFSNVNLGRVLISDTECLYVVNVIIGSCCILTGASINEVFMSFCTLERSFPECDSVDGMYELTLQSSFLLYMQVSP